MYLSVNKKNTVDRQNTDINIRSNSPGLEIIETKKIVNMLATQALVKDEMLKQGRSIKVLYDRKAFNIINHIEIEITNNQI